MERSELFSDVDDDADEGAWQYEESDAPPPPPPRGRRSSSSTSSSERRAAPVAAPAPMAAALVSEGSWDFADLRRGGAGDEEDAADEDAKVQALKDAVRAAAQRRDAPTPHTTPARVSPAEAEAAVAAARARLAAAVAATSRTL
jgi:hypothetical protein